MTDVAGMIEYARSLRTKLIRPPNAVKDMGIDLKRRHQPPNVGVKEPHLNAVIQITEEARPPSRIRLEMILRAVENCFSVGIMDIKGHNRKPHLVLPRYVAIHLALKHLPKLSTISIGRLFDRDHTTIIHARRKMDSLLETDKELAETVLLIEQKLLNGHYD